MFHPLALHGRALHLDAAKHLPVERAPQIRGEDALVPAVDPEGARVLLHAHVHAPVALVLETGSGGGGTPPSGCAIAALVAGSDGHGHGEGGGEGCV